MHDRDPQHRAFWLEPAIFLATCGWLGRIPIAPGTFGSLLGLPLSLVLGAASARLVASCGWPEATTAGCEAALIAILFLAGIPVCGRAARLLRVADPGPVVLDEALAVPWALVVVPPADRGPAALVAAFVLFRLFDIIKPPPVCQAERLPGGLGIMADDQAAAALAAGCLAAARWQGWL